MTTLGQMSYGKANVLRIRQDRRQSPWFWACWAGVAAVLFASPMAFGAVEAWAWGSIAIASAVLLMLWACDAAATRELNLFFSPAFVPVLAFCVLAAVQCLTRSTQDYAASREGLIKLTADVILFFLAAQLTPRLRRDQWRRLGKPVALFAGALSLYAILQFFSSPDRIYWVVQPRWGGSIFGPYVNRNNYAGLMEMLIPLAGMYVLEDVRDRALKVLFGFAILLAVISTLLTASRGGMFALFAELVIAVILLHRRERNTHGTTTVVVVSAALAIVIGLFAWVATTPVTSRLGDVLHLGGRSQIDAGVRLTTVRDSLRLARSHLALGTGLGSFETAFRPYQTLATDLVWDHAHNDYVEALVETGVLGEALIWLSLGLFFRSVVPRVSRATSDVSWLAFGAMLGCCGILVHSLLDFNLHIPANAAWFAVLAGIALSAAKPASVNWERGPGHDEWNVHKTLQIER